MKQKVILTIDIGGTNLKGALVPLNTYGEFIDKKMVSTIPRYNELKIQLENIIKYYINNLKKEYNISGIGVATAGRVDHKEGKIIYATDNIKGLTGFNIRDYLQEKFDIPVIVDNDGNAACWGEYKYKTEHQGENVHSMCLITLGTGVGGGLVINEKLVRGNTWKGGEIGHMKIKEKGRKCTCGYKGCWECYVGKKGILKTAKKFYDYEKISDLSVKDIYNDSPKSKAAEKTINRTGYYLAIGIKNLIHIFDPEIIVLGGGISRAGDKLINSISTQLYDNKINKKQTKLEIAYLGNQAGQIGIKEMFCSN